MMKKIFSAALAAALLLAAFTGCNKSDTGSPQNNSSSTASSASSGTSEPLNLDITKMEDKSFLPGNDKAAGYQLEKPADGEKIVVLTTSMGEIKIRLFPEAAPKAVENFMGLVEKGYYNGLTFHRVVADFMIQSGDPKGDGTGGKSLWNESFQDEFTGNLMNLRGALSMANSGYNTNGSQFFIVQTSQKLAESDAENAVMAMYQNLVYHKMLTEFYAKQDAGATEAELQSYASQLDDEIARIMKEEIPADIKATLEEAVKEYEEVGGTYHLDYKHTVFGQVFEGLDVVDQIAAVEVVDNGNNEKSKPAKDVTITKAEVQTYKAS